MSKVHLTLIAAVAVGLGATNAAFAAPAEDLVPANFTQKTDALGFRWDIGPSGSVSDGTNDCFDGAMALLVNGSQFRPRTPPMMTRDGRQYVLTSTMAGLSVTRQILVDAERGAVRYLDVFANTGRGNTQVQVSILSRLGSNAQQTLTTSGAAFTGSLGRKDAGIITIGVGNRPCVLFLVADPRSKTKPTLQVEDNCTYRFNYTLTLKPSTTVSLCYLVAQRHGVTSKTAPDVVKAFYKARLLKPEVPKELVRTVANFRLGPGAGDEGPGNLLQDVADLAASFGVERGKADVLVFDDAAHLAGEASAGGFVVETAFGKAQVGLRDVALLFGGAGVGRPMRLHLRSGEVLAGGVQAADLKLKTASGMEMSLTPEQVNLLFTHADPAGTKPAPDAAAYLQTHLGDRLALAGDPPLVLEATTAWGDLKLSLDDLAHASYVREPQPGLRLALANASQFPVVLRGGEITATTLRFGPVRLSPHAVAGLVRVEEKSTEDDVVEEEIAEPHWVLAGESVLVGALATPRLHLITSSGVTPLDAAQIRRIERKDDVEGPLPTFAFELRDGGTLTGRLEERVVPVRAGESVLRVPAEQVVSFVAPEPKPDAKGEAGDDEGKEGGADEAEALAPETQAQVRALERALAHADELLAKLQAAGGADAEREAALRQRAMLLKRLEEIKARAAAPAPRR